MRLRISIAQNVPILEDPSAFEEIRADEDKKLNDIKEKYQNDMKEMREQMEIKFNEIISMIQQNPVLVNIKPKILVKI